MSELWKSQPKEVLESWIRAIIDEAEEKLSDWERNFVGSIEEQLLKRGTLSQKQQEILEKIYTEKTS